MEFAQLHSTTLGGVKKILEDDTLHAEQMGISRVAARDYCMKDGEFVEFGRWLEGGQGTRSDLRDVSEAVLEGKDLPWIARNQGEQFIKYHGGIAKQMALVNKPKKRTVTTTVFWGKPGCGKTTQVEAKVAEHEAKGDSVFWLTPHPTFFGSYAGQKVIVIDDFNSEIDFPTFLKLLAGTAMEVFVKNGQAVMNAETVYITSNTHPKTWYAESKYNQNQLAWRITRIIQVKRQVAGEDVDAGWCSDEEMVNEF